MVERFWDIIEDININKVLLFLKDNIVGTVVLVTALLWIPASCVINYIDKKRHKEEIERYEWRNQKDLIHPSDNIKRTINIRIPNGARLQAQSSSSQNAIIE